MKGSTAAAFYDGLADEYHLVYGGSWESASERQGGALDRLLREAVPGAVDVLDCACGIGTQTLGLARLGYRVVGTDVSAGAIERARREARRQGLAVEFAVADC